MKDEKLLSKEIRDYLNITMLGEKHGHLEKVDGKWIVRWVYTYEEKQYYVDKE